MNLSHRSIKAFLFSVLSVFIFQASFSQIPEAEIELFIRDYAKTYENITKSRDKQSVLNYVSKDLFSTIIKSNVVDDFGLIQSSYADFDAYLGQLLNADGMVVEYKVKEILRSIIRGKTGVVLCEIAVQVSSKGEIWNKGIELTTFTLKKFNDGWKIMSFNVVGLEEEQNKGTCLIETFKASSGSYMIKTIVPMGDNYETNFNNFEFNPGSGVVFIRLDGENSYSWIKDGPITRLANGNQVEHIIGSAIDEYEAVLKIVKLDLYNNNCTGFKNKN